MSETRSYIDSKRNELLESLYGRLTERFSVVKEQSPGDLATWAVSLPAILDGKPFTFEHHEYLKGPYSDLSPYQVYEKAAQVGISTLGILRAIYGLKYGGYKGVGYFFPAKSDITDFARGRIDPLIADNPNTIARWVQETDNSSIKKIAGGFLYFRGMRSRVGVKSIPLDLIILDEMTEANDQSAVDRIYERMAHSTFKHVLKLSNPTLPNFSISKEFTQTDQRYWFLKCPACGHWNCMEDNFVADASRCLLELPDGRVIRACLKCQTELDPSQGEWVAKSPRVEDRRGYHFSQLYSFFVDPGKILRQFRTTNNLADFWNLVIGMPYIEAQNRLVVEEVLSLCGSQGVSSSDSGPCSMGVDQGKELHVVIGKRHATKAGQIVHVEIYRDWTELDRLVKIFNVARCVVDALPETRNARAFAERNKGKVFLNYYSEHQKGRYKWNEGDMTVTSGRTESLDASHNEIMKGQILLPRECDIVRQFATHLANVAKKLQEDEDSGSKKYIYLKLGPDHFRHAFNYEAMARQYGTDSFFGSSDLR